MGKKKTLNRYDIPFGFAEEKKNHEDYNILVDLRGIFGTLTQA